MARKSAATATAPAFVFDPETLVPPLQVPAEHKEQYWTALLDSGIDALRAACATEEFFPLLREIPKALWEKRFMVYLYRTAPKVRNAEKPAYIDKYPYPIDEGSVKEEHGGGGYIAYLNMDSKEQLKQITFNIEGAPKLKPGQVLVDNTGAPLPAPAAAEEKTDLARIIDAQSSATEKIMGMMQHSAEKSIDMIEARASNNNSAPQTDPLATVKALLEIVRPQPNPVQDELMKAIIARAFAPVPTPPPAEERETPVDQTLSAIEKLSGGKSLAELMVPAAKAAAADSMASWVPIAQTAGQVLLSFAEKLVPAMHERTEQLRLELQIRQTGGVPAPPTNGAQPPRLPAPTVIPPSAQPQPTTGAAQPLDPHALVQTVVKFICDGFDRDRNEGSEIAATLDVMYGDQMETLGITRMLAKRNEVETFIQGIPELLQCSKDARWPEFFDDFMQYTEHTYGEEEPPQTSGGPQVVEGAKPPAA